MARTTCVAALFCATWTVAAARAARSSRASISTPPQRASRIVGDATSQTCSLRLLNEAPASITLYVDGVPLDGQTYHGIGAYNRFPCNSSVISVSTGSQQASYAWNSGLATLSSTFTAFTTFDGASTRVLQLSVLVDVDAPIGDNQDGGTIDACNFRVVSGQYNPARVAGVTAECYNCLHPQLAILNAGDSTDYMYMDCAYAFSLQVSDAVTNVNTTRTYTLLEHGAYTVVIQNVDSATPAAPVLADLLIDVPGRWPFTPIFIALGVLIGLGILHRLLGWILIVSKVYLPAPAPKEVNVWNPLTLLGYDDSIRAAVEKEMKEATAASELQSALLTPGDGSLQAQAAPATPAPVSTKPRSAGRIRSIDTLRGACLCIMIFVNYGAGNYEQLDHSKWNGLTLADLVFPIFVWTQGVSMAISFAAQRRKSAGAWDLAQKTIIRSMKLFALGLFLNNGSDTSQWRIPGVLQYFAVAYLVVGLLESLAPGAPDDADDDEDLSQLSLTTCLWRDIGRHWAQWLVMSLLMVVYLVLRNYYAMAGCPLGYIGPGGLADQGAYPHCTGGAARLVDQNLFGLQHIYHSIDIDGNIVTAATCGWVYLCDVHDPEGALGWITAAWMTFLGLQSGRVFATYARYIKSARSEQERSVAQWAHMWRLAVWGITVGTLGAGLAGFSKNEGWMPICKNLWSPSFITTLSGTASLGLSVFYYLVDVLPHLSNAPLGFLAWSGAPFAYIGMNSIVIYAGHELLDGMFPFATHVGGDFASHSEAIASNLAGVACWLLISRVLYLKKIFINI